MEDIAREFLLWEFIAIASFFGWVVFFIVNAKEKADLRLLNLMAESKGNYESFYFLLLNGGMIDNKGFLRLDLIDSRDKIIVGEFLSYYLQSIVRRVSRKKVFDEDGNENVEYVKSLFFVRDTSSKIASWVVENFPEKKHSAILNQARAHSEHAFNLLSGSIEVALDKKKFGPLFIHNQTGSD